MIELSSFAKEVEIIIPTVNNYETLAVLQIMKSPSSNFSKPTNIRSLPFQFVIGMFGGYKSAQVKTGMGNDCDKVISEALRIFPNASAIIAVGVAYAFKREKCQYGDVLVSKHIHCLKSMKVIPGGVIARSNEMSTVQVNDRLIAAFTNVPTTWQRFQCNKSDIVTERRFAKVHCGGIINGSILVADEIFRDRLLENYREAIGGEMEASMILSIRQTYQDINKKELGVIIIKGVADYGDSKKEEGKPWQFTAALAAASYTDHKLTMTKGGLFGKLQILN